MQVLPEQTVVAPDGAAAQQLVPQRVLVQLMSQADDAHTPLPLDAGGGHTLPQVEQFYASLVRLTQAVPQRVFVPQSTTQALFSQSCPVAHLVLHEPQYCVLVLRSTAPVQVPQALLLQVWLPVLQLPQLCVAPFMQATQRPELGKHWGVAPVQVVWLVQAPLVEQRRGVAPTQPLSPGLHTAHFWPTQKPVAQSVLLAHASPTPQLPQLILGPEHEFRLTNAPASLHW